MDLVLDRQGRLYEQIARALKLAILDGRLAGGSRLPSTRSLAVALRVSRTSVLEAYELLCAEQLVTARAGSGTRVAQLGNIPTRSGTSATSPPTSQYAARVRKLGSSLPARPSQDLRYNLEYGTSLVTTSVFKSWRRKLGAAVLGAGPGYAGAGGFMPLRRALADLLGPGRRGLSVSRRIS